jgi:hypothetical protein
MVELKTFLATIFLIALLPLELLAHAGGTDSSGGHHDRKNGGYHYHSSSSSSHVPPMIFVPPAKTEPRYKARTSARTSARSKLRESASAQLPVPNSIEVIVEEPVIVTEPAEVIKIRYVFHHKEFNPYMVEDFEDNDTFWYAKLALKSHSVNLKKDDIVRIEAKVDSKDYRTWYDTTGRFAVVAKTNDATDASVTLQTKDSRRMEVLLEKLSNVDREHVRTRILQENIQ